MIDRHLHRSRVLRLIPATALLVGCSISFEPRGLESADRLHDSRDVEASSEQVRLRMRSLVDPMTGQVEAAADRILASTDDPAVRRAAIEWKSQAVPALREALFQPRPAEALFQPRPAVALFDTWACTYQMIDYFSTGPGGRALGSWREVALDSARGLEREMTMVAASFTTSGDVEDARAAARRWAKSHPIKDSIAHRESALSLASEMELGLDFGAGESVGTLAVTADDLNRRLEVYTDQLTRQARWEAELLAMDLAEQAQLDHLPELGDRAIGSVEGIEDSFGGIDSSFGQIAGALNRLIPVAERLAVVAETAPDLVARERAATLEALRSEVDRSTGFVREERATALEYVSAEREIALGSLHGSIAEEREILTRDLEAISQRAIDHAILRVAQLLAVIGGALLLFGIAALILLRRLVPRMIREWREAAVVPGS